MVVVTTCQLVIELHIISSIIWSKGWPGLPSIFTVRLLYTCTLIQILLQLRSLSYCLVIRLCEKSSAGQLPVLRSYELSLLAPELPMPSTLASFPGAQRRALGIHCSRMRGSPGFCGELGNYCYTTSPCCTTVHYWNTGDVYIYKTQLCSTKPCRTPSVRSESQEWCWGRTTNSNTART